MFCGIFYFQVVLQDCESGQEDSCVWDDSNDCVVNDLEGCTNYTVEMYVYNAAGRSDPMDAENTTAVAGQYNDVIVP